MAPFVTIFMTYVVILAAVLTVGILPGDWPVTLLAIGALLSLFFVYGWSALIERREEREANGAEDESAPGEDADLIPLDADAVRMANDTTTLTPGEATQPDPTWVHIDPPERYTPNARADA